MGSACGLLVNRALCCGPHFRCRQQRDTTRHATHNNPRSRTCRGAAHRSSRNNENPVRSCCCCAKSLSGVKEGRCACCGGGLLSVRASALCLPRDVTPSQRIILGLRRRPGVDGVDAPQACACRASCMVLPCRIFHRIVFVNQQSVSQNVHTTRCARERIKPPTLQYKRPTGMLTRNAMRHRK